MLREDVAGTRLEERIESEQATNDRLEREIADLKAEAQSLILSAEERNRRLGYSRERGSNMKAAVNRANSLLGERLEVRLRQKKESDERLAALKREKQQGDQDGSV